VLFPITADEVDGFGVVDAEIDNLVSPAWESHNRVAWSLYDGGRNDPISRKRRWRDRAIFVQVRKMAATLVASYL